MIREPLEKKGTAVSWPLSFLYTAKEAAGLPPGTKTHVNVPAGELVSLAGNVLGRLCNFRRAGGPGRQALSGTDFSESAQIWPNAGMEATKPSLSSNGNAVQSVFYAIMSGTNRPAIIAQFIISQPLPFNTP